MLEIITSTTLLDYRTSIQLEGTKYIFRFLWSDRSYSWLMDIYTSALVPLIVGRKILINVPLLQQFHHLAVPPGELIAIDTLSRAEPPGKYELGDRVKLVYATAQEMIDLSA